MIPYLPFKGDASGSFLLNNITGNTSGSISSELPVAAALASTAESAVPGGRTPLFQQSIQ